MTVKISAKGVLVATALLFFAGCNAQRDQLGQFNQYFEAGKYEKGMKYAQSKLSGKDTPKNEDLLWNLQIASSARMLGDNTSSITYMDAAEEMIKYYDMRQSGVKDAAKSTLVNETFVPYQGQEYDGVMVNTYKGLDFMAQGKYDLARVEFNRALERQRRSKQKFSAQINKLQKEIAQEHKDPNDISVKNTKNPEAMRIISEQYSDLESFQAYPDFVNPFATYAAGLFFAVEGDHSKSVDLLKEAYGMVPANSYLADDLATIETVLNGSGTLEGVGWLIFENGLGPVKEEWRLDLPLFVATDKVKYWGIALPKLKYRQKAYDFLKIDNGIGEHKTEVVCELDNVVKAEFREDFKGIVTRAIISSTSKAAAQYALERQNSDAGSLASIAVAIYQAATTAADVRMWTALPKDFQVARFDINGQKHVTLSTPDGWSRAVDVPDCQNLIIYVRIIRAGVEPVVTVIPFGSNGERS